MDGLTNVSTVSLVAQVYGSMSLPITSMRYTSQMKLFQLRADTEDPAYQITHTYCLLGKWFSPFQALLLKNRLNGVSCHLPRGLIIISGF